METSTEERTTTARSRTRPAPRRPRGVRPVTARRGAAARTSAPRLPFVLLILGLLGGAMVTLLMLHAVLAEDTFEIATLQQQNRELSQQEQALRERVVQAESPEAIAEAAEELGMRPGAEPQFLDLESGRITGDPDGTGE
ncbi:MAG TPA: hypothetical protein VKZ89_09845 [Thermobifida alba]|nr:hypothetical protein [Thermobifida alba]